MTLSPADRAEMRKLAEKATPGPFFVERRDDDCGGITYIVHGAQDFAWCKDDLDRKAKFNAAFTAAAHPQAVLGLLDALDAAEKEVTRQKRVIARELSENDELGTELSYVAAMKEENARLRTALDFYADKSGYISCYKTLSCLCCTVETEPVVIEDSGSRARAALAGEGTNG